MAVDMFLKIESPPIKGESLDDKHKEDIDVLTWSWNLSNSGNAQTGGGAGAGKVNVGNLSVTKFVDKATTDLFLSTCNGQHHDTVTLFVRKAGTNPIEYIKITMSEVLITSLSTGGSGSQDRLTENIFSIIHEKDIIRPNPVCKLRFFTIYYPYPKFGIQ